MKSPCDRSRRFTGKHAELKPVFLQGSSGTVQRVDEEKSANDQRYGDKQDQGSQKHYYFQGLAAVSHIRHLFLQCNYAWSAGA
jgi:hypothetical protein